MQDTGAQKGMTISDLALCLLDLPGSEFFCNKKVNFKTLDSTIDSSFLPEVKKPVDAAVVNAPTQSFTVASRMSRNNLTEQARMDALIESLRKIRVNHDKPRSGRVIRGA